MQRSALILGASGRIGQMLRHFGLRGVTPHWQYRQQAEHPGAVVFDPLKTRTDIGRYDTILCLAGVISGSPDALCFNRDIAEAALNIGAASGAQRVFFASSAAVYGRAPSLLYEASNVQPVSDYGRSKAEMEDVALSRGARLNLPVTILRIGNVAGADALLGQPANEAVTLDRFPDGGGARRSYIGPTDLAVVMNALLVAGAQGNDLPSVMNLALPGPVDMADLLDAAGRSFAWRSAPDTALPLVGLDTTLLSQLVPLPDASAAHIVADWQSYMRRCA